MDPQTGPAELTIRNLFWKLIDILEEDVDGFLDEVSAILPTSQEMYRNPTASGTQHERVVMTLNLILKKGEETCMNFLQHLQNMRIRFPKLSSLSGDFPEKKKYIFDKTLQHLRTEDCKTSKLSLKKVLSIRKENLKDTDLQSIHFLRKLLALNRNARNTYSEENTSQMELSVDDEEYDNVNDASASLHPLDVVCALLHCSDHFLQQEIVFKMSMCQFAVPLLLPAGDGTYCTLMLWAMRDIVKRWTPHSLTDSKGFMEDNVVNVPMPTFSFVRLGKTKLSKSKILNQVLGQDQQHLDFFIHDDMEGGNIERKISDGLVEMSWYFPSGSKSSDAFEEPIAVTNLRGDLESNWNQFSFLTRVSSAVFIFTERIGEREIRVLSNCNTSSTKYDFFITHHEKYENLKQTGNICIMSKKKTENDRVLVKKIRHYITKSLKSFSKKEIETMKEQAFELGIHVDELVAECSKAREDAGEITNTIKDVARYKNETMSLQGERWKEISKLEKELCRMRKQGKKNVQEYQSELIRQSNELYEKQYACTLPHGMEMFIKVMELPLTNKLNFLKYMKIGLGSIVRENVLPLQAHYMENCKGTENQDKIKELDQKICDSSLGIEHFLREMGQFYEAACVMSRGKKCETDEEKYARLPGMAADLLLDGFPLELIDGDASNIPMQWVSDVLKKVDTKTGGRCKMRVITVLGVQSTGKSTLLNTMFGLQFPVASGRCTRGAFMTLLRVEKDFIEELGCDFILVIDTEGLKAPELASLEDSYEHDNELAMLVVGLSDITIINMAMENAAEMMDTLQIVVHAFLRMKEIGKKPKCLFVHQNVSDVSNYVNNMRDRKKLRDMLDKMTMIAAKMENKSTIKTFNDMIDYDIEKDNWYIPGLWLGGPPMAAVNLGYSENISELKKYLLTLMGPKASMNKAQTFSDFIEWVKSLWKAAKHEKFIFSFRNSLVAQAYQKLSMRFSQWEWDFTKAVYSWVSDTEMQIRNLSPDTLQEDAFTSYQKNELQSLLHNEKEKMLKLLENYFEDDSESSVHLIERYKEEYRVCVDFLKNELERNATNSFNKTFQNQKWKINIQRVLDKYQEILESKVINLLGKYGEERCEMSDTKLEEEFEVIWKETMSDLQAEPLLSAI
uniref:VLIG-type G domain-containing protein n=1 Tax=Leptobrachium leishanense TaxID=445787 RepID=A0A8C5QBW5_9ANUR